MIKKILLTTRQPKKLRHLLVRAKFETKTIFSKCRDDPLNLKQKVLSFISKSWAVEKEVIQCFDIKKVTDVRNIVTTRSHKV